MNDAATGHRHDTLDSLAPRGQEQSEFSATRQADHLQASFIDIGTSEEVGDCIVEVLQGHFNQIGGQAICAEIAKPERCKTFLGQRPGPPFRYSPRRPRKEKNRWEGWMRRLLREEQIADCAS